MEIEGEPVEADASPEFEVSLTTEFVELPEIEPFATSGTAVFTDQELFAGVEYDVTVEEDPDSIPEDPGVLFGLDDDQVCELAETTIEGDETATPGTEDHAAEVTLTNAYECTEVLSTTSVEVAIDKLGEAPDDVEISSDLELSFTPGTP